METKLTESQRKAVIAEKLSKALDTEGWKASEDMGYKYMSHNTVPVIVAVKESKITVFYGIHNVDLTGEDLVEKAGLLWHTLMDEEAKTARENALKQIDAVLSSLDGALDGMLK